MNGNGKQYSYTPIKKSNGYESKMPAFYDTRYDENVRPKSTLEMLTRFWQRLRFDEWTFTLMLFLFSSSVVIGKLFLNYDCFNFLDIKSNSIAVPSNRSNIYYEEITNKAVDGFQKYSWLIKALFSGFTITGLTWCIIYKDSKVPGIEPPSPFSPSKKRILQEDEPPLPTHYFVGILNGFLVFLYMCL
ncbi:hypothetical protein QAD02_015211 [Eretmocerus hayati]|uniref:Uncharacterized protein n=1 Tax=Eretmocerus hayati TaxID=131215 RepID=A0ACC2P812_9HYME|nr:hypothetical protein QAD02_015211 [Eretmocerus hayati]